MIIEINNSAEFEKYVASGDVLVDFNATWCGPCKMLSPILEQLDREGNYPNLKILKVDVDKVGEVAARYGIQFIPALFYFKEGQLLKKAQGYHTLAALKNFIDK